jgi:regulator of protease activity HflC (stomatin/prohibitin superfamily)
MPYILLLAAAIILFIIVISIRQINQYEKSVKFMFGKYYKTLEPGWRLVFPIIQSSEKVDMRIKAVDVPDQSAITKDNVSVNVNAVIYYKVVSAEKSILEIENFRYAIMQYAQTTMRNVVGEATLDELLAGRDHIADRIKIIVESTSASWGLEVINVELKDIRLPGDMERTIAKQAEAEREKRAVIITSEGELAASKNMAEAARTLSSVPGALHLRTLQSINDLSSDQSNTVVFTVPLEVMQSFTGFLNTQKKEESK